LELRISKLSAAAQRVAVNKMDVNGVVGSNDSKCAFACQQPPHISWLPACPSPPLHSASQDVEPEPRLGGVRDAHQLAFQDLRRPCHACTTMSGGIFSASVHANMAVLLQLLLQHGSWCYLRAGGAVDADLCKSHDAALHSPTSIYNLHNSMTVHRPRAPQMSPAPHRSVSLIRISDNSGPWMSLFNRVLFAASYLLLPAYWWSCGCCSRQALETISKAISSRTRYLHNRADAVVGAEVGCGQDRMACRQAAPGKKCSCGCCCWWAWKAPGSLSAVAHGTGAVGQVRWWGVVAITWRAGRLYMYHQLLHYHCASTDDWKRDPRG
jgi:hypothetical protein